MELVVAKGLDWTLMALMNGDLTGLLSSNQHLAKLRVAEHQLEQERAEARMLQDRITELGVNLNVVAARLRVVEESVTWRLLERVRVRVFRLLGGKGSPAADMLQAFVRLMGRALLRGGPRGRSD
jgi:hypothetical protein